MLYGIYNEKRVMADYSLPLCSKGGIYYCPYSDCDSRELVLKKGSIKQPHFAHKIASICDQYSEPESETHLQGKLFLANLFTQLGYSTEIEWTNLRGVRPDIYIAPKTVIELQCSPILVDEIKRRNQVYYQNTMIPIWIFAGDYASKCNDIREWGEYRLKEVELYLFNLTRQKYVYYLVDGSNQPYYNYFKPESRWTVFQLAFSDITRINDSDFGTSIHTLTKTKRINKHSLVTPFKCNQCGVLFFRTEEELWKKICYKCWMKNRGIFSYDKM